MSESNCLVLELNVPTDKDAIYGQFNDQLNGNFAESNLGYELIDSLLDQIDADLSQTLS